MLHAKAAFDRLVKEDFNTILDIGAGAGDHTKAFQAFGKIVTSVDYFPKFSTCHKAEYPILPESIDIQYDAIWCSHVLEHQASPHEFLQNLQVNLKENGWLAITVPPMKNQIVGGHLSLWNCGLLVYHLILAGWDCRDVKLRTAGYNCTAIVQKKKIEIPWENLRFANGDLEILAPYAPPFFKQGFNGDIDKWNWD